MHFMIYLFASTFMPIQWSVSESPILLLFTDSSGGERFLLHFLLHRKIKNRKTKKKQKINFFFFFFFDNLKNGLLSSVRNWILKTNNNDDGLLLTTNISIFSVNGTAQPTIVTKHKTKAVVYYCSLFSTFFVLQISFINLTEKNGFFFLFSIDNKWQKSQKSKAKKKKFTNTMSAVFKLV